MQTFYILVCITTPPSLPQKQKSTHPNSHTCHTKININPPLCAPFSTFQLVILSPPLSPWWFMSPSLSRIAASPSLLENRREPFTLSSHFQYSGWVGTKTGRLFMIKPGTGYMLILTFTPFVVKLKSCSFQFNIFLKIQQWKKGWIRIRNQILGWIWIRIKHIWIRNTYLFTTVLASKICIRRIVWRILEILLGKVKFLLSLAGGKRYIWNIIIHLQRSETFLFSILFLFRRKKCQWIVVVLWIWNDLFPIRLRIFRVPDPDPTHVI